MEEDNFKDVPDQIEEIKVKSIILDSEKNKFLITFEITPPDCNNRDILEYSIELSTANLIINSQNSLITFEIPYLLLNSLSSDNIVQLQFIFSCRNCLGKSPLMKKTYQLRKFVKGSYMACGQGLQNQFNLDIFDEKQLDIKDRYNASTQTMTKFTQIPLFQENTNYFTMNQSSFLITSNGMLIQWGFAIEIDENNQTTEFQSSHFQLEFPLQSECIVNVVCGQNAAIALTFTGHCYSWGINTNGQLGQCDRIDRANPTLITSLKDKFIKQISFSYFHALALTDQGGLYVWGKNQAMAGKEILNSYNDCVDFENLFVDQINPRFVDLDKCIKISTGCNFSACITTQNKLYAWGSNIDNQLGIQFSEFSQQVTHISIPRQVNITQPVIDVSCGFNHTLLIVQVNQINQGQLWSYGYSKKGQCGHGDLGHRSNYYYQINNFRLFPSPIQSVKDIQFIKISAGQNHSFALSHNNQLYAFGSNRKNQLGEMETTEKQILAPIILNEFIPELTDKKIIEINAATEISSFLYCNSNE